MFPTSRIICFDSRRKGLNDWFCRRSCWRACRFGWFSIFWFNSSAGTLRVFHNGMWLFLEFGSPCLLLFFHEVFHRQCWVSQSHDILEGRLPTVSLTGRPVLSWVCSTFRLLLSSDERAWISCVSTSRPVLSEELSSLWKEFTLISWERDVPLSFCISSSRPDLSRIGLGICWVGWKNFARLATSCDCRTTYPSGCWSTVEPNGTSPLAQSWRSEIFGGGRGDMYDFSNKTSPVFNLTTFGRQ